MSLAEMVGTRVTLEGSAQNAKAGALLLTAERTPVYIDGLARWDDALLGTSVRVTGTLRTRDSDVAHAELPSGGIPDARYMLEGATWT